MQNKIKFLNLILMLLVIIPFGVLAVAENGLNIYALDNAYIEDIIGDPQYEFIHNWDSYYSGYDSIDIRLKNDPGITTTRYEGGSPAVQYITIDGTYFYLEDSDDGYGIKMDILPGPLETNPPIEFRAGDPDGITHTQWRDFTYDLSIDPNPLSQKLSFPTCHISTINDETECLMPFSTYFTDKYTDATITNHLLMNNGANVLNEFANLDLGTNFDESYVVAGIGTVRITDSFISITASDLDYSTGHLSFSMNDGVSFLSGLNINYEIGASEPIPIDGLANYYSYDINANDEVGSNDGVIQSGVTQVTGLINNGYSFPGTTSNNHISHSDFLTTIQDYSISLFFKADVTTGTHYLFYSARPQLYTIISIEDNTLNYKQAKTGGGYEQVSIPFSDTSTFHHVVMTWDGSIISAYLDGVLVGTQTATTMLTGSSVTRLGAGVDGTYYRFFDGIIDEFAFFGESISLSEVESLYNNGNGNNPLTIPSTTYDVSGSIYSKDQNNQYDVMQGETIILTNEAGDTVLQTDTTTIAGIYNFDIEAGTYDIYYDQVASVNIIEDNIIVVDQNIASSDYFIDILTPEQISSQASFSISNGNSFNLPMTSIFDYASEMEATFTVAGVTTTISEGVEQCFSFGCLEIDNNVLYLTTAGTGIISDIYLTGINYYGATNLNEYVTDSTPLFDITVTDTILDPPDLVVPIPDFTDSIGQVRTFLISDYFTKWDTVTLGFQDDIAEQSVLLSSGKGLASDTYNVNHVTVTLTPLVDDVRVTLTAKLVSDFSTNIELKVFNADGLSNDIFGYNIVNLANELPIVKEQILDFNSVVDESYIYPMNDYFYNSDNIKATFTIGSTVYTLEEGESLETELGEFTIVFNSFVFNPKEQGLVTNIILTGINNNGETSMLPFETTINYPIQIPGIKKQIESSIINFNAERIYNINDYFKFYDNFYVTFYYNNSVYNLAGDDVLDLGFADITLDQTEKTLLINSKELFGKFNDIVITAINVHGTNTLNPFTVEVQTGGEFLTNILGSGVIFPDSTTLTSTQKWTYASLTVVGIIIFIMALGFFITRNNDISPALIFIVGIICGVATFFYFIAIKYIPIGVLIVVVLLSGAIIYGKSR